MIGQRVETDGELVRTPGSYWKSGGDEGKWYCHTPGDGGFTGSLGAHDVTEHEDGTITVSPSILITKRSPQGDQSWHGFLERGVWREA